MKVRATRTGFSGGGLRLAGEEFDVPDGRKASWWVPVAAEEPVASPEPASEPEPVEDKPKTVKKKSKAKKKS